jgi:hypothetical protein
MCKFYNEITSEKYIVAFRDPRRFAGICYTHNYISRQTIVTSLVLVSSRQHKQIASQLPLNSR